MLAATPEVRSIYDTDRDPAPFVPFIQAVGRGEKLKRDLTYEESVEALRQIVDQTCSPAQAGAFLITQRVKGEAVDEVRGFTALLRAETITRIYPRIEGLLDLAVPYDGKVKSAQLAPAVAVVLSEAGMPVVLHGDEGVPTKEGIGPGPVLRELGIADDLEPEAVQSMIEAVGIGYLSAERFAPQWHDLLPLRRQFGLRTVLNSVEKLLNPGNAPYQVSGFFHGNYIERLREVQTGAVRSFIVQGEEGSVEMAVGRKSHVFAEDAANDLILDPEALGHKERVRVPGPADAAGHAELNARVLASENCDATEQVCLTAGVILHLFDLAQSVSDGINRARRIIESGAARARLERAAAKHLV
ncbi:MAG: anthranilate phosphoribosyltransferase [Caldilineaceae bacterium SB0664_bin_27]|uniref:Anthranilate phosphoribosyltransferase n=1 Tax=Caldilineaceae bacterium SB0664_bin_27 TaxID=2605260 RepID=A0A6B0YVS9_9CHLR|nr:anthranilate phosphoribosyltransferase [Caldilineaceae bacterium SB0664_bin_27]